MKGRTSLMDIILVSVIGYFVLRSIKLLKNDPNNASAESNVMKMLEKISDKIK
jgi:hypothetical protein